jgi:hypothetical protein
MVPLRRISLLLGLSAVAWFAPSGDLHADYACGSLTTGHCYGTAIWEEQPQYFGAYADIDLAATTCASCDGFTTNELWVVDNASPACVASPRHKCWLEAGYFTWRPANHDTIFFWADSSPQGGFRLVYLDRAPEGSLNHFMIVQDARTKYPGPFRAYIYNTALTTLYNAESSSFRANRVIVGKELSGTHGTFASTSHFTRNIWAVRPLGPEYVFWYAPQTTTGGVRSDDPPHGAWSIPPDDPFAPEGGVFTTHCWH